MHNALLPLSWGDLQRSVAEAQLFINNIAISLTRMNASASWALAHYLIRHSISFLRRCGWLLYCSLTGPLR
jgi:hypothetical protein